ncbi:hypothetical protein HMPREF9163_01979 [Selenomonas sp. oral taxon 138 str. F0429]|nr:hypothetical protein HMPREF9163_01979 [Selenomonas sp. oral taxon 138 str. F0429]
MLPLSRRVAVFLYCNISEPNRATKEFFSISLNESDNHTKFMHEHYKREWDSLQAISL